MKRLLLWVAALLPGIAVACYNDRDTLGYELQNKPDVQRALTGRFDRYPPLYYAMRVDRLRAKGKLTPDEYGDLAVALDRQGKSDEALAAIETKGKLPGLDKMDEYRFYANRGTIRAHKWLRESGNGTNVAELQSATNDIAKALQLNPKAHFGREGTQLEVLRWIIDLKKNPKNADSLGSWLSSKLDADVDIPTSLAGLIMLGAAWESSDAAFAIAEIEAEYQENPGTAALAMARYDELVAAGKPRFVPQVNDAVFFSFRDMMSKSAPHGEPPVKARFAELRKEADDWSKAKTDYVMERLQKGKHPDIDPNFWSDWREPVMPVLPTEVGAAAFWLPALYLAVVCLLIVTLIVVFVKQRRKAAGTAGELRW